MELPKFRSRVAAAGFEPRTTRSAIQLSNPLGHDDDTGHRWMTDEGRDDTGNTGNSVSYKDTMRLTTHCFFQPLVFSSSIFRKPLRDTTGLTLISSTRGAYRASFSSYTPSPDLMLSDDCDLFCSRDGDLRTITTSIEDILLCKERKIPKIRDYYGSGWVSPGLTWNFFLLANRPKIVLNQC